MQKQPIQEIKKPVLLGSWHGKDAYRLGRRLFFNILAVSLVYLILSLLLNFNVMTWRIVAGVVIVLLTTYYLYANGLTAGEADASFAEIMYQRDKEGKAISQEERDRCFHPAKGFFAVLLGATPYVLIALVFAFLTKPALYSLGVLPNWLGSFTRQSEFGDALQYYAIHQPMDFVSVLRVVIRAMTMPFINIAVGIGDSAALWCERLSALWILIAPTGFAIGYSRGLIVRTRINTGIVIGMSKKQRKKRREQSRRAKSKEPEQLI